MNFERAQSSSVCHEIERATIFVEQVLNLSVSGFYWNLYFKEKKYLKVLAKFTKTSSSILITKKKKNLIPQLILFVSFRMVAIYGTRSPPSISIELYGSSEGSWSNPPREKLKSGKFSRERFSNTYHEYESLPIISQAKQTHFHGETWETWWLRVQFRRVTRGLVFQKWRSTFFILLSKCQGTLDILFLIFVFCSRTDSPCSHVWL